MSNGLSPTAEVNLVYELKGEVKDVDVFRLAPALLSYGELIREANRTLNEDKEDVSIRIRPFFPGSFGVDIVLVAHVAMGVLPFITEDRLKRVREIVGAVKATVDLIKELKGKKGKSEEIRPGEFRYQSDNNTFTVNGPVHQLIQNPTIIQNVTNVFADPMDEQGVTDIKTFIKGEEADALLIGRDDARHIREFAAPGPMSLTPPAVTTTETALLNPKSGPYGGKGGHFWFSRGGEAFPAKVEDKRFLDQIEKGEIRLHHSDVLTVEMEISSSVEDSKVTTSRRILSVADYKPGEP